MRRHLAPSLACITTTLLGACATMPAPPPAMAATGAAPPAVAVPEVRRPDGQTAEWWFRYGASQAAARGALGGKAKNVILFVGDGMSLPTVAAARILDGQRKGQPGEGNLLSWERFPATAFSRTYNTDTQTPDSAGTMTAMATGVKSRYGVISVGPQAARYDCEGGLAAPLLTLWELAASSGMATGVVTTTKVTHATPGATFAHVADRGWESDTAMAKTQGTVACTDIALQIVGSPYGTGPDVLMGGGRENLLPSTRQDPEYPDRHGARSDGRDLAAEWQQRHPGGSVVWNSAQLDAAPATGPLLGLFEPGRMHYLQDVGGDGQGEPTLARMTREAIVRLRDDPDGYVLLVEGALIDYAHHEGNAFRALDETIALSEAVAVADEMTSDEDTLILVTADHAHTMSFVGYPVRGNPILGKVVSRNRDGSEALALDPDGLPYTTLVYANGPGHVPGARPDLREVDTEAPDYHQEALVPRSGESHGGDDVGIWARGPGADAVRGSVEQNTIFHFLLQATPVLRAAMCARDYCNADGVPVELPDPAKFRTDAPVPGTR